MFWATLCSLLGLHATCTLVVYSQRDDKEMWLVGGGMGDHALAGTWTARHLHPNHSQSEGDKEMWLVGGMADAALNTGTTRHLHPSHSRCDVTARHCLEETLWWCGVDHLWVIWCSDSISLSGCC